MTVPGYFACDCDKYNPDCRCYPRKDKLANKDRIASLERRVEAIAAQCEESMRINESVRFAVKQMQESATFYVGTPPIPAPAGDDAEKWAAVFEAGVEAIQPGDSKQQAAEHYGRAAIAKAIELGLAAPSPPKDCPTCHNTGAVMEHAVPNGIAIKSTNCPDCGRRQVVMNDALAAQED